MSATLNHIRQLWVTGHWVWSLLTIAALSVTGLALPTQLATQAIAGHVDISRTELTVTADPSVSIHPMTETVTATVYLPLLEREEVMTMVERRALWITRYDWTLGTTPGPETLEAIVAQAAAAGFNTIFFQIRGEGDAYYKSALEPWSARLTPGPVSETLGLDPGWDPLAKMIELGHAAGMEVHAYVNVYTAWLPPPESQGNLWPPATTPPHMFDLFTYGPQNTAHPGIYALGYEWRQYSMDDTGNPIHMPLTRGAYLWATPGLDEVNAHILAVVRDIVLHYPVDGIHLDRVRYASSGYSYDPASNAEVGATKTPTRDQWQRDRVTKLVQQINTEVELLRPGTQTSAAVWPIYINKWGWDGSAGYTDYYQDSKGWLSGGALDAIVPMMYGSTGDIDARWEILLHDFLADSAGRPVYPGIGAHYQDFAAIAWRIETARAAGAQGHAIFSYGALEANDFWDELATGPYRIPAVLP